MNFFRIEIGTPTRRGGMVNQVERFVQTEAEISAVRVHFSNSYAGLAVNVSALEAFEPVVLPDKSTEQKVVSTKEGDIETFYRVKELEIALTEEQQALIEELKGIESQRYQKDEALTKSLNKHWEKTWWTDNGYSKTFERRGTKVFLKDVRIKWPVIMAKGVK